MNSFTHWWQYLPEKMNPVFLKIGSFAIHYYGLMYVVAFLTVYLLCRYRLKKESLQSVLSIDSLQGTVSASILGLVIGARLGYVIFYNLSYYIQHPLEIILPFDIANGWKFVGIAGMSFHGGLIGLLFASVRYMKKRKLDFDRVSDIIVPCTPLGYTFGRLGNFINSELWGRTTEKSIGMYFPGALGEELRHPSQLYEAFFEGIVLFGILWILRKRMKFPGTMLAFYLIGYGLFRFFIEFVREPDAHLGFIFFQLSMGQLLCLGMILVGGVLFWTKYRRHRLS